jgi:HrpA-like RNA helicase
MGIGSVMQFPFPSRPPSASIQAAVDTLLHMGALTRVGVPSTTAASSGAAPTP